MDQINEIIAQVGERLAATATSEVVVGAPMQMGNLTVVALSRVSIGLGAGGGYGEMEGGEKAPGPGKGQGGGTGGGAKVRPVAIILFGESGVQVFPIPEKVGKLDKLIDAIPGLIEKVKRLQPAEKPAKPAGD
jgi:uncharacterized spore protein YtfJ